MSEKIDFRIANLGEPKIPSPIHMSKVLGDSMANYVTEDEHITFELERRNGERRRTYRKEELIELAGPREKIFFNPGHVHAGIVTCGGLCPGLNDVIRAIVRCLWNRYGVRRISGIQMGYKGLLPDFNLPLVPLTPDAVDDIHKVGGTILGSSRGGGNRVSDLVDAIERVNLTMLFTIGGDGTQRGARDIANEIARRGTKISIIGIPKTIDNDLSYTQKSFGFETAVARACEAVAIAHTEAHSSINGIGLVKLMGREAGFIDSHNAISVHEANFVLIPEVPFELYGANGFLANLEKRLARRNHAVIIAAEGAGRTF